jgi:acetyl esterase/lipase
VCVSINYRLSPKATWPEHLVDCKRALGWVRAHIAEYGGDPDLVCVTGGSAGAHLAAMVALTAGEARYQPGFEDVDTSVAACIPFYGVYDFLDLFGPDTGGPGQRASRLIVKWMMKTTPDTNHEAFEDASPIHHLSPTAPPFFVIHGSADNLVPVRQARTFVARLRAVSEEPVLYAEVPGASHAFDVFHSPRTENAVAAVGRFLGWIVDGRGALRPEVPPTAGLVETPTASALDGTPAPGTGSSGRTTTARTAR